MIGWVVLQGYDCEGLSGLSEPYTVYLDREQADEAALRLNGRGTYGVAIEVALPDMFRAA